MTPVTKPVRIALYCRVSRILGQCIENQITPLTEFAKARGYHIAGTYADEGQSGGKTKRPQLDAMLRDARAGKFDVLGVQALDRLGRDLRHLLSLLDELRALNVQFVSLRENINDSASGRLFMSLIGSMAEYERNLIRTRIREALAAKRILAVQTNSGWRMGRPPLSDAIRERVLEYRAQGMSLRGITKAMGGTAGKTTIARLIKQAASEGVRTKNIEILEAVNA